jgi:hypothetical protein
MAFIFPSVNGAATDFTCRFRASKVGLFVPRRFCSAVTASSSWSSSASVSCLTAAGRSRGKICRGIGAGVTRDDGNGRVTTRTSGAENKSGVVEVLRTDPIEIEIRRWAICLFLEVLGPYLIKTAPRTHWLAAAYASLSTSESGAATLLSSISVSRTIPGTGSSTTSTISRSTTGAVWAACRRARLTRFRDGFAATFFVVFLDFFPVARLIGRLPGPVRFLAALDFVLRTAACLRLAIDPSVVDITAPKIATFKRTESPFLSWVSCQTC